MIVNSAAQTADNEFVFALPRFQVQPPGESPFAAMPPTAITQLIDTFDLTWVEGRIELGANRAEMILDDILLRSRKDVERFPSSSQAHANFGLALLNRGQLNEAVVEFLTALQIAPRHFVSMASLARIRVSQGLYDEAKKLYMNLCEHYPDEVAPFVNLAYILIRESDLKTAEQILEKAINLDIKAVLPRYLFAIVQLQLGNAPQAISHLRAASRSAIRSPEIHQALGVAYLVAGESKRAVRSFKTALTLAPDRQDSVRALSMVLLQHGETESLIELLSDYLEKNSADNTAREILAEAYLDQKQFSVARTQYLAALRNIGGEVEEKAKDKSRLLNNVGVCFDHQGENEKAEQWFLRSIEVHPGFNLVTHHNLARLRIREERFEHAWKILEECKSNAPENHETPVLQAAVLSTQERYDEAIILLKTETDAGNAEAEAYADLGSLLTDAEQDPDSAHIVLSEGIRRFPNDPRLLNNLAYAHLMNGDPSRARKILETMPPDRSKRRLESEVVLTATRGLLSLWEGDFVRGRDLYLSAQRLAQESRDNTLPDIVRQKMHLELARAHLRHNDIKAAKSEISRGLAVKHGRAVFERDLIALRDKSEKR